MVLSFVGICKNRRDIAVLPAWGLWPRMTAVISNLFSVLRDVVEQDLSRKPACCLLVPKSSELHSGIPAGEEDQVLNM